MRRKRGKMKRVDEVRYSAAAKNFIKKANPQLKMQIKENIEKIKVIPSEGDIKPMQGYNDGRKRLRFGKYRIVFKYEEDGLLLILDILDVGPRGDIYKQEVVITSTMVSETMQLLEMLPENELKTVNDLVKLLVRSWDPEFTKVTNEEKKQLDAEDAEMSRGVFFTEAEVWEQTLIPLIFKKFRDRSWYLPWSIFVLIFLIIVTVVVFCSQDLI